MDNPIHNKTWDVTNGKLRFYEPTNLGIEVGNNLWGTGGIGVLGARAINQPQMEFKLETFGGNLQENYTLLNNFVNDLLSVKYVTLEYQTEWFQVFADIALNEVTKTEGYGQNGTFSEKIVFDIVTKWYTFENLELKTIENGEIIDGISKVYGGQRSANQLPNFNMEQHTRELIGTNNQLTWGQLGNRTKTISRENVQIEGLIGSTVGVHFTQETKGQAGWRGPTGTTGSYSVTAGQKYTISAYFKNNSGQDLNIDLQLGLSANSDQSSPTYLKNTVVIPANSEWVRKTATIIIPSGINWAWSYVYTSSSTVTSDWSLAGLKVEQSQTASSWLPTQSEMTSLDYAPYAGYRYIQNQAYTYYGETHIERLARWDIKEPFFSFIAKLTPSPEVTAPNQDYGLQFLDVNGNEYSAIVFNFENRPDLIAINTDVNDEWYQATTGDTVINAFPALSFSRYRTRIFQKGQMTMKNLSSVEIKVKRKVDFV